MPRKGENIYKRKDSRWEGRYIRGYDPAGKAQFGYVYARTYGEVKKKLLAAKQDRQPVNPGKKDLASCCDEWLLISRSKVKESTYVKYYTIISRHLKPELGSCLLQNMTTVLVEQFSHKLLMEKKLSAKTVRDILAVLKSVLKYAETQCNGGTIQSIKVIYPRESRKEMRVLTYEEQNRLIKELTDSTDTVKFGILLALITGLRIGEICALKWGDISLADKMIHVSQTMQRLQIPEAQPSGGSQSDSLPKTKILVGEAKSSSSDRYIPLTDCAMTLCANMKVSNANAYVLTGSPEKYMEPRNLQNHLHRICQNRGLEEVHFHTLRHTFATRCVEAGFEVKSLSEILGHSNTKVTLDRYVHSSMELKRSNMEKLSVFGQISIPSFQES